MGIFWIVIILVVVGGAGLVFRGNERPGGEADRLTPLEIASQRYARGEIDAKEYRLLKKELS